MPPPQETYDIPDVYDHLDELRVPSPSALSPPHNQRHSLNRQAEGAQDSDGPWATIQPGHGELSREPVEEEYYSLPNNYSNLHEVTATSPVESLNSRSPAYLEGLKAALKHGPEDSQEDASLEQRTIEDLRTALQHGPEERQNANATGESSEPSGGADRQAEMGVCHALQSHSPGEASPPDSSGPKSKPSSRKHGTVSRFATELYTISYLIFFSILGTLARLGLQALTFYPGAPVQTGVLWANFAGTFILGFLLEDRKLFRQEWGAKKEIQLEDSFDDLENPRDMTAAARQEHAAVKKTIPLYIGLATGFCGSFTSFSSFMRDAYFALSNALPLPMSQVSTTAMNPVSVPRNPGYGFLAVVAVLIVTTALCLVGLQAGAHLALALESITPTIPFLFARKIVDRTVVFIAFASWLGATVMSIWPPDRFTGGSGAPEMWRGRAVFALVFAPLGCLLRFYASLHLNGRLAWFPLGTFTVNMLGTAMEGMLFDLQHVPVGSAVGCQVLQGAMDGFCGCLTTVSTWVAEIKGSGRRAGYVYGLSSVGVGLSLVVIIMGSLQWSRGFQDAVCTH